MRVDLEAEVQTRDGKLAGTVRRAIVDPHAQEVSDFVISTGGLFGHDVVVPREHIAAASLKGRIIRLDLTRDELKHMPEYEVTKFTDVPATGWVPPTGFGFPVGSVLWPVGYVPVTQEPAASAGEEAEAEIWSAIKKRSIVRDRGGDPIGVVDDVQIDKASGHLQGMVIRAGGSIETFFGGGQTIEVGSSQVERVDAGEVYLRAAKEQFERGTD
jgi:sporulation protein YlmC with PRC-barrel domain